MPALPEASYRKGAVHTIKNLRLTDHWFKLPLTHGLSYGKGHQASQDCPYAQDTITVFAREVVDTSAQLTYPPEKRPYLIYLQGGPGGMGPRPVTESGWVAELAKSHRLILLDQRGTGNSTPLSAATITAQGTPEQQAQYLELFRADSIIADAEKIRQILLSERQDQRWSTLGQSYGGFLTLSYLSFAPQGLKDCRITAGLAPIRSHIDRVYQHTLTQTAKRNRQYYSYYPEDIKQAQKINQFLRDHKVILPTGERLTDHRFQMLGVCLGANSRIHSLHYILESAFAEGPNRLSSQFLAAVSSRVSYESAPLYALLHESIYADGPQDGQLTDIPGQQLTPSPAPTNWSAARMAAQRPEFCPQAETLLFTGEHIFPWYYQEDPALRPLQDVAHLLAEKKDWGRLYDHEQLKNNPVPLAAAAYTPDIYVDYDHSMQTAQWVKNSSVWTSQTHHHDGLSADSTTILEHLKNLLANMR